MFRFKLIGALWISASAKPYLVEVSGKCRMSSPVGLIKQICIKDQWNKPLGGSLVANGYQVTNGWRLMI